MKGEDKTQEQLMTELRELRQGSAAKVQSLEARFRDMIEKNADGIIIVDKKGIVRFVNPAAESLFGRKSKDLIGELFGFPIVKGETKEIDIIRGSRETVVAEMRVTETEWEGEVASLASLRDVTERKQAEEALRKRTNDLGERVKELNCLYRVSQFIAEPERALHEIFQETVNLIPSAWQYPDITCARIVFEGHEFATKNFSETQWKQSAKIGVSDANAGAVEVYYLEEKPEIDERPFLKEERDLIEDLGRQLGLIAERRRAEQELRQSRDKLQKAQLQHQAVLRSTPHGLCVLTSNWIITWANSAMVKILGLKPDTTQKLKFPFKTLFANEKNFNDYQKSALHSVRTTGIDVRELELRWPDGRPLWCEISIVRIDPRETAPGLVATFSDITERKQAEEERKQSLEKIRTTLEETVNALASAVEIRDPYTAGHQRRVAQLACAVAKEMDMSDEQIEAVHMAGLIHDIGKISVPAEILSKPSRLTEMEMNLIKSHPQVSFDILKDIEFPWPVAHIVLQHHERMNGTGYPHGLSGKDILLEARILAVADVVEAMASHRPYRPALGTDKALEEILRNKGILYDAAVVNTCAKLLAEEGFDLDKIRVTRERRKSPRVNVELPCEVQLLMPDETFQPRSSHGCIMDLSMRGAKVRISSLLKDVFQKLLRPNRYVKLIFSTPESERKLKVIGKIVSMEFKEKEQLLDLRAYFENVEPKVQTVLQRIVEQGS